MSSLLRKLCVATSIVIHCKSPLPLHARPNADETCRKQQEPAGSAVMHICTSAHLHIMRASVFSRHCPCEYAPIKKISSFAPPSVR
jgi:hypothetical protein